MAERIKEKDGEGNKSTLLDFQLGFWGGGILFNMLYFSVLSGEEQRAYANAAFFPLTFSLVLLRRKRESKIYFFFVCQRMPFLFYFPA